MPRKVTIRELRAERVEDYSDERDFDGGSIIITLRAGWTFSPGEHERVRGFGSVREVNAALRSTAPCFDGCPDCAQALL